MEQSELVCPGCSLSACRGDGMQARESALQMLSRAGAVRVMRCWA